MRGVGASKIKQSATLQISPLGTYKFRACTLADKQRSYCRYSLRRVGERKRERERGNCRREAKLALTFSLSLARKRVKLRSADTRLFTVEPFIIVTNDSPLSLSLSLSLSLFRGTSTTVVPLPLLECYICIYIVERKRESRLTIL